MLKKVFLYVFAFAINFFQGIYALARRHGALVISDEVQAGLGRLGSDYWGFQHFGVVPDIVTVGKPLGNGQPMGAVICTREVSVCCGIKSVQNTATNFANMRKKSALLLLQTRTDFVQGPAALTKSPNLRK